MLKKKNHNTLTRLIFAWNFHQLYNTCFIIRIGTGIIEKTMKKNHSEASAQETIQIKHISLESMNFFIYRIICPFNSRRDFPIRTDKQN